MAAPINASPVVRVSDLPKLSIGSPFSFTGSVTLTPGGSLPVNEDALKNNTGRPLEVRELKFTFTIGCAASNFAAMIGVKTAKGTVKPITQTPVPVSTLGIRRGAGGELVANGERVTVTDLPFLALAPNGHTVWRLDVPFYLLPGETLLVTMSHLGFVPNSAQAIVTMSGNVGVRVPLRRMLPYVTAYIGQQIDKNTSSIGVSQSSTEKHLVNGLTVPVRVSRFVGRFGAISAGRFGDTLGLSGDFVFMADERYVTITMRSSTGVPTVRFDTPFARIFEPISTSWECPHVLPPKAYYIMNFKVAAAFATDVQALMQVIPLVSMHGVREDRP
jgi:hypothetical protein